MNQRISTAFLPALFAFSLALTACGAPVAAPPMGATPSAMPTMAPSSEPTAAPTAAPTTAPSVAPVDPAPSAAPVADIVATAIAAGRFTTLARALGEAELVSILQGAGPFTVFAPNDAAFAKIPSADLNALLADKEALRRVLLYHVVAGSVDSEQVSAMTSATTQAGDATVSISTVDGAVRLNGNTGIVNADIPAGNGIIHEIDTVLMPPAAN